MEARKYDGRHYHGLWPSFFSGRHCCGRHCSSCGHHCLWPSLSNPTHVRCSKKCLFSLLQNVDKQSVLWLSFGSEFQALIINITSTTMSPITITQVIMIVGDRADTRDRQTHHYSHRRHQGNHFPVPTPFHGSSKRECGRLPEHHDHRVKRRCIHYTFLSLPYLTLKIVIVITTTTLVLFVEQSGVWGCRGIIQLFLHLFVGSLHCSVWLHLIWIKITELYMSNGRH